MKFKRRYRIRRKRYGRPPRQFLIIMTLVIFVVSVGFSFWIINARIEPIVIGIAKQKTNEFATRAINAAVNFGGEYNFDEMLTITYDNEGHIATYNQNPAVINEINNVVTDRVEEFFMHVNEGRQLEFRNNLEEPYDVDENSDERVLIDPTLVEIPLGQITGNATLSNLGPRIPINMEVLGTVRTNVVREEEEFGINGSWVSLYMHVEADVQIIVPFTTEVTTVDTEIYMDGGAIMGKVPDFYGGGGNGPDIAVPRDDLQNE